MYTNLELIKLFRDGGNRGKSSSMSLKGNRLYSYKTVIAIRTHQGILLNTKRYSSTTTRAQNLIKEHCNVIDGQPGVKKLLGVYKSYCLHSSELTNQIECEIARTEEWL